MAKKQVATKPQLKAFTIYYFQAEASNGALQNISLQKALSKALKFQIGTTTIANSWQNRVWQPGENDSYLIDIYQDDQSSFFGDLGMFSQGHMQAMIETQDTTAKYANVKQQTSPEGTEYLRSMMYWMAVENHVLAIQSTSIKTTRLGQYLTWLLSQKTAILAEDSIISLSASLNADEVGGLDEITGLVIGGADKVTPVAIHPTEGKTPAPSQETVKGRQLSGWGDTAKKVLRAIIPEPAEAEKIIREASETGSLKVFVDIRYRRKKRGVSEDNDLAAQLCQTLSEGQFRAKGKHGKISQKDIRLHYPVKIQMRDSLPDIDDVRAKLNDAYEYFINEGKIE